MQILSNPEARGLGHDTPDDLQEMERVIGELGPLSLGEEVQLLPRYTGADGEASPAVIAGGTVNRSTIYTGKDGNPFWDENVDDKPD